VRIYQTYVDKISIDVVAAASAEFHSCLVIWKQFPDIHSHASAIFKICANLSAVGNETTKALMQCIRMPLVSTRVPNRRKQRLKKIHLKRTSKVTIATGSSVLCTIWGSVLRIHSHGGATYMLLLHTTVRVEKKLELFYCLLVFSHFLASFCKFCYNEETFSKNLNACTSSSY